MKKSLITIIASCLCFIALGYAGDFHGYVYWYDMGAVDNALVVAFGPNNPDTYSDQYGFWRLTEADGCQDGEEYDPVKGFKERDSDTWRGSIPGTVYEITEEKFLGTIILRPPKQDPTRQEES